MQLELLVSSTLLAFSHQSCFSLVYHFFSEGEFFQARCLSLAGPFISLFYSFSKVVQPFPGIKLGAGEGEGNVVKATVIPLFSNF